MLNRLQRWLQALPIYDPIDRRQALLVQVVLIGLGSILVFSGTLTLIAFPFTSGAIATANLRNSISNFILVLLVVAPLILLRRGAFRRAVAIFMIELFLFAFLTFYSIGLEKGWIGIFALALPISLAALVLGRRWLLAIYLASVSGVAVTAFARYPLSGLPQNAPSIVISFVLIAGLFALFLDRFGAAYRESLAALREGEARFRRYFELGLIGMAIISLTKGFLEVNDEICAILGYERNELVQTTWMELTHPDDQAADLAQFNRVLAGEIDGYSIDKRWIRKDNQVIHTTISITCLRRTDGSAEHCVALVQDITERKRLEAQLLQSQKMESIGQLAGGIAHDFNNMLSIIIGFIGSAKEQIAEQHPAQRDLTIAESSAWRAAALTRQLLAFARKQVVEPRILNLNEVIVELDKMLRRLIGEDIELITLPADNLGQIKADPGQIEQVIANLVVNARDAMPHGGRLIIETANTTLDSDYAHQHVGVVPGDYVLLAVSDTGIGMDVATQQRIFEPFYTTKEVGKGTGLGLATCYGIIKQHGGNIWVYSEVGHGTTFKIYLPQVYEAADTFLRSADQGPVPRGTEIVLLVEDEPLVRESTSRILSEQGYTVLEAVNGDEAMQIIRTVTEPGIALLITDVVMPHMGGKVLAEQVTSIYPTIKVLFVSGYATDAIIHQGRLDSGTFFLSKPFTRAAFARKVREVLDNNQSP